MAFVELKNLGTMPLLLDGCLSFAYLQLHWPLTGFICYTFDLNRGMLIDWVWKFTINSPLLTYYIYFECLFVLLFSALEIPPDRKKYRSSYIDRFLCALEFLYPRNTYIITPINPKYFEHSRFIFILILISPPFCRGEEEKAHEPV